MPTFRDIRAIARTVETICILNIRNSLFFQNLEIFSNMGYPYDLRDLSSWGAQKLSVGVRVRVRVRRLLGPCISVMRGAML